MGEYRIRMRFDIAAEPGAVQQALTTAEGIAAWWSDAVEGQPGEPGGELRVAFPDLPQPFRFAVGLDDDAITWATKQFPPWWDGTTIIWTLAPGDDGDGCQLSFAHVGFDPDDDIIAVITPAWADIIRRLKGYAETGRVDPFARN
jgi:uncharacterized protein YndB with AHSA1/START domain